MNRQIVRTVSVLGICLLVASGSAAREASLVLIDNVSVVDVENGEVLQKQQILIHDGQIEVGPSAAAIPEDVRKVDGAGKFVIPGLIDAHVHFCAPQVFAPLALVHGVTLVRDLGGDPKTVLMFREQLASGALAGPEMMAVGPILDGEPPVWPFSITVTSEETGRAAVQTVTDAGFDEIKVYSRLEAAPFRQIIDEGHDRGLRVIGHVPDAVSLKDAVGWGLDESQHLMGVVAAAVVAAGKQEWAAEHHRAAHWQVWQELSPRAKDAIVGIITESAMAVTPTLAVYESLAKSPDTLAASPWSQYIPAMLTGWWASRYDPERARNETRSMPARLDAVQRLHARGVPVLAGTDLCNPNVVPGVSLHRELALFIEAGMTPLEALRSATVIPAQQLRRKDLGVIRDGAIASLVLLDKNPLISLDALEAIHAVAVSGQWYDRAALDGLLAGLDNSGGEDAGGPNQDEEHK